MLFEDHHSHSTTTCSAMTEIAQMMEAIVMMIRTAAVIIALVPLDLARKGLVSLLANLVALIQWMNVALA